MGRESFPKRALHVWYRVAAVLLLPLMFASLWLYFRPAVTSSNGSTALRTINTPFGTTTGFVLPDGTEVWLNSGSTLTFPEKFDRESRNVTLQGEAFFNVHADKSHPFIVKTPSFSVRATGTRFNVLAYKEKALQSVSLEEGKVDVSYVMGKKNQEETVRLEPGQHLGIVPGEAGQAIFCEDIYKYFAWKDGKMVFRNDLLSEVMQRISLQYNVDVEISDKKLSSCRFRATFNDESLTQVLDLLKLSSPIDYHDIKPRILPDGSFSRRKIIIYTTHKP